MGIYVTNVEMQIFTLPVLLVAFLSRFTVILPLLKCLCVVWGGGTQILEFVFLDLFIVLFECLWTE